MPILNLKTEKESDQPTFRMMIYKIQSTAMKRLVAYWNPGRTGSLSRLILIRIFRRLTIALKTDMVLKLLQSNWRRLLSLNCPQTERMYPAQADGSFPNEESSTQLFHRAKSAERWNKYRESLTAYNKAIRQAKRDT